MQSLQERPDGAADVAPNANLSVTFSEPVGETTASAYLGFYSDSLDSNQITDYLIRVVQPKLQSVAGVTQVHGADVWVDLAPDAPLPEAVRWDRGPSPIEADALVTQTPTAPPTPAATAGPVLVVGAGLLGASIGRGLVTPTGTGRD